MHMQPSKGTGATYVVEYEKHPKLNGEYVEDGTMEGKPKFKQRGGRGVIFYSGGRHCTLSAWDGSLPLQMLLLRVRFRFVSRRLREACAQAVTRADWSLQGGLVGSCLEV